MKLKVTLTRGCSGSGKTTWAEKYCSENKHTVNINRDDLRDMLFCDYKFSKQRESLVTSVQMDIAEKAIKSGYNVIISDTNINPNTVDGWKFFAKDFELDFEIKDFVVDFEVLKKRNDKRGLKSIPIDVLRNQYKRYTIVPYSFNKEAPKAILFDIDGTLAEHNGRSAYDLDNLKNDTVIESVKQLLDFYKQNYKIIIFSGREAGLTNQYKISTEIWLKQNDIHYDLLKMRLHKDHRPDYLIKDEMIRSIAKEYNIVLAIDDRQQVVDMYRLHGLEVFQVAYGDF